MRFLGLLILLLISNTVLSQKEKMSYYFDNLIIINKTVHPKKNNSKVIIFSNSKDSTYALNVRLNDTLKEAILRDSKKKRIIKFDVNFDFQKEEDLNHLNNSKLYTIVELEYKKNHKNSVEFIEYERDTVSKKTIVHLTRYKNKKKKEIINEYYYFFGENSKIANNNSLKKYLFNKHDFELFENEKLEKILILVNGKIDSEIVVLENRFIDYNFEFPIDEIFPKRF